MPDTFSDHKFALRFRDLIRGLIRTELAKVFPSDRYGVVNDVDYVAMKASVIFGNATVGVKFPFAYDRQPTVLQVVRVSGRSENRHIAAITSPAVWEAADLSNGDWVVGAPSMPTPAFVRDFTGLVRLRGTIGSGTAGTAAFTLRSDCTPAQTVSVAVPTGTATFTRVDILSTGDVVPRASTLSVSLDGIVFDTRP